MTLTALSEVNLRFIPSELMLGFLIAIVWCVQGC